MELPGPWVAAEANDDIRRNGIGLDPIGPEWSEIDVPGQWQHHPKFAASNGPVLYRTNFHAAGTGRRASPMGHVRRRVVPGRRVARRRVSRRSGGLLRPAQLRHHRSQPVRRRTRPRHRGHLHAAGRHPQSPEHHRRAPAVGMVRPVVQPGRAVAPRPALRHRAGAHRSSACALSRCRPPPRPPAHRRAARQRRAATDRDPHADRRRAARRDHARGGERRQRPRMEPRSGRPGVVVAAFARRPAAHDGHRRGARRRRVERPSSTAHRAPSGDVGRLGLFGQRRADLPQGRQPAADEQRPRPRRRPRPPATTSSRRSISASTRCACTGTSPIATPTTPPTNWASCSCRTSRCSGGMPDRSAPRRSIRRGPSSTRSGTIRRSCRGRPTTTPHSRRSARAGTPRHPAACAAALRAAAAQQLPSWNKSILDRWVKRSFERSDPTRATAAHSGVVPHLPQLDGTDSHLSFGWRRGEANELAGFARRLPRMVRFVSEFGADSVPTTAPFIDDELAVHSWPDLDWERIADENAYDLDTFERLFPPDEFATFEEWQRDHAVLPSARPQGADRTAAHVEVPAHRWVLLLEPRRPGPDRVVERARPRTGAEGRLRDRPRRVCARSSSSPNRRPTGSIPAAGWISTCTRQRPAVRHRLRRGRRGGVVGRRIATLAVRWAGARRRGGQGRHGRFRRARHARRTGDRTRDDRRAAPVVEPLHHRRHPPPGLTRSAAMSKAEGCRWLRSGKSGRGRGRSESKRWMRRRRVERNGSQRLTGVAGSSATTIDVRRAGSTAAPCAVTRTPRASSSTRTNLRRSTTSLDTTLPSNGPSGRRAHPSARKPRTTARPTRSRMCGRRATSRQPSGTSCCPTRSAYPPPSASTTDASTRFIGGVPTNCATNTSCGWS